MHELEALEHHGWQALAGPDGAAFYRDLMADDGLMVFPGLVLDKRQSLEAIAGAPPWSTFELVDILVIEPSRPSQSSSTARPHNARERRSTEP